MVLCAGLGTRLRPLTDELPKPLVPIGDRSMLAHIAERLRAAGLSELVINVHHLPGEFASEIERFRGKLKVVREIEIRGTAGGVAGARHLFGPAPILVWNGDIWVEPPIAALMQRAEREPIVLAVAPRPLGQGVVGLGRDGEIVRLRGETFGEEQSGGDYVGVCALGAEGLTRLPERGCLIGDLTLPLLREGRRVPTLPVAGRWSDVGDVASYLEENLRWLADVRGGEGYVGEGAAIGSEVRLERSVVGAGARIGGAGAVTRSVIWPGAYAVAPLTDVVVTRAGRVVARGG